MNLYIDGDIFDFVMYYIYGQSGPSLLIESTDSMITYTYTMYIYLPIVLCRTLRYNVVYF